MYPVKPGVGSLATALGSGPLSSSSAPTAPKTLDLSPQLQGPVQRLPHPLPKDPPHSPAFCVQKELWDFSPSQIMEALPFQVLRPDLSHPDPTCTRLQQHALQAPWANYLENLISSHQLLCSTLDAFRAS